MHGQRRLGGSRTTLDGVGVWAFSGGAPLNTPGVVAGLLPVGGTYTVAADGRVLFAGDAGSFSGAMVAGGGFVLLAGSTVGTGGPRLALLARVGGGLSSSTFLGNYWVAGIAFDAPAYPGPPPPFREFTTFHGHVFANGAGVLTYGTLTRNTEGVISTSSGPGDFAVLSDGTLRTTDVARGGDGPFRQGASPPTGASPS